MKEKVVYFWPDFTFIDLSDTLPMVRIMSRFEYIKQ